MEERWSWCDFENGFIQRRKLVKRIENANFYFNTTASTFDIKSNKLDCSELNVRNDSKLGSQTWPNFFISKVWKWFSGKKKVDYKDTRGSFGKQIVLLKSRKKRPIKHKAKF